MKMNAAYIPDLLQFISLLLFASDFTRAVDLNKAIFWTEEAVRDDRFPRFVAFSSLGIFLWKRFGQEKLMDDLERAVTALQNAVDHRTADGAGPSEFAPIYHLRTSLRRRFE